MKEGEPANTLGDGGNDAKTTKKTRIAAYLAIVLLLIFALWSGKGGFNTDVNVEHVASITSWSVGATATESILPFLKAKKADLSIEILEVGQMDENGNFETKDVLEADAIGAMRISIKNAGKATSGQWELLAKLPTKNRYNYSSGLNSALKKGEEKVFIFSFDKLHPATNFEIKAGIIHSEEDLEMENNTDSVNITIE